MALERSPRRLLLGYGGDSAVEGEWRLEGGEEGGRLDVLYNGPVTQYAHEGLEPATVYHYRLSLKTSEGASPPAATVPFETLPDVPDAPAAPELEGKASPFGCGLKWSPPKENGASVEEFELQMEGIGDAHGGILTVHQGSQRHATMGELGDVVPLQAPVPTQPRLQPASRYRFRVRATNAVGPSPFSPWREVKTPPGRPAPPAAPHLRSRGESELEVGWHPGASHGAAVENFKLEVRLDDDAGGPAEQSWNEAYLGQERAALLGGFKAGQSLLVRVSACNAVGWGHVSPAALFTTAAAVPLPPPMLEISREAKCSLRLSWGDADGRGSPVESYVVLLRARGEDGASGDWWEVYKGPQRECEAAGLQPGWRYDARVRATNHEGHGAWSTVATGRTKPGAPEPSPVP